MSRIRPPKHVEDECARLRNAFFAQLSKGQHFTKEGYQRYMQVHASKEAYDQMFNGGRELIMEDE